MQGNARRGRKILVGKGARRCRSEEGKVWSGLLVLNCSGQQSIRIGSSWSLRYCISAESHRENTVDNMKG